MATGVSESSWTLLENLLLAQHVYKLGDNWSAISRGMKQHPAVSHPAEFFSQKNCSSQYNVLVQQLPSENFKQPKPSTTPHDMPAVTKLARQLYNQRLAQLQENLRRDEDKFRNLVTEIEEIRSGKWDPKLESDLEQSKAVSERSASDNPADSSSTSDKNSSSYTVKNTLVEDTIYHPMEQSTKDDSGPSQRREVDDLMDTDSQEKSEDVDMVNVTIEPAEDNEKKLEEIHSGHQLMEPTSILEQKDSADVSSTGSKPESKFRDSESITSADISSKYLNGEPLSPTKNAELDNPNMQFSDSEPGISTTDIPEPLFIAATGDITLAKNTSEHTGVLDQASDIDEASVMHNGSLWAYAPQNTNSGFAEVPQFNQEELGKPPQSPIAIAIDESSQPTKMTPEAVSLGENTSVDVDMLDASPVNETIHSPNSTTQNSENNPNGEEKNAQSADQPMVERRNQWNDSHHMRSVSDSSELQFNIGRTDNATSQAFLLRESFDNVQNTQHRISIPDDERESGEDRFSGSEDVSDGHYFDQKKGVRLPRDEQKFKSWQKNINLIWREISNHKSAAIFMNPISEKTAPNYFEIVKKPIDLKTIKQKIRDGLITNTAEFHRDILLMFTNALMYNSENTQIYQMAMEMREQVEEQIQQFISTENFSNNTPKQSTRRDDGINSAHSSVIANLRRKSLASGSDWGDGASIQDDEDQIKEEESEGIAIKRKRI